MLTTTRRDLIGTLAALPLAEDPFGAEPERLRDIRVERTLLGGQWVLRVVRR